MYFQPIVVASILIGVWGIIMTMKMLAETLKDYHMQVSSIKAKISFKFGIKCWDFKPKKKKKQGGSI